MAAHPEEQQLLQYARGALDAAGRRAIEAHLDSCTACLALVGDAARAARQQSTRDERAPAAPLPVFDRGVRLGRYLVLDVIGAGGMGVVLSAYDHQLDRKVALKLVRLVASARERAELEPRLMREARAVAQLSHPNVVMVHDVGTFDGLPFMAMELIDGLTLRRWLEVKGRTTREVLDALAQAGRGLQAAHAAGLVHRDFKPENVLVETATSRVRVTDFGLARSSMRTGSTPIAEPSLPTVRATPFSEGDPTQPDVTRASAVVGTPAYMAPEQWTAAAIDARADQFSFCAVLFEALTGERPFATAGQFVAPLWPKSPRFSISGRLKHAIERGLALDPQKRFDSMQPLLQALEWRPRRLLVPAVAAGVVLVSAAGLVGWFAARPPTCGQTSLPVEQVWSAPRRASIQQRLLQLAGPDPTPQGLADVDATMRALDSAIGSFSAGWSAQALDSCRATLVRRDEPELTHAARQSCLRRQLESLDALVEQLIGADAAVAIRAREMALQLPRPMLCAELQALLSVPAAPASARVEVEAAQRAFARAQVSLLSGSWAAGAEQAKTITATARALGYRPLLAQAEWLEGWFGLRLGRLDDAEKRWQQALADAVAVKDDATAARAATELAWVIASERGTFAEAHSMADLAAALVARGGNDPDLAGKLENNLGAIAQEENDYAAAASHYQRALQLRLQIFGEQHPETLKVMANLALNLTRQGRHADAVAQLQKVLALQRAALGPRHPMIATTLVNLADSLEQTEGFQPALERYREALELRRATLGDRHPLTITTHSDLGRALERALLFDEARAEHQLAIELAEAAFGGDSLQATLALEGLARHHTRRGQHAEALSLWSKILDADRRRDGGAGPETTSARRERALAQIDAGQQPAGVAELEATLAQVETRDGASHANTVALLLDLGRQRVMQRQPALARPLLERALTAATLDGWAPAALAEIEFLLAQAVWNEPRERDAALQLAARAQAHYQAAVPSPALELANVQAWQRAHRR